MLLGLLIGYLWSWCLLLCLLFLWLRSYGLLLGRLLFLWFRSRFLLLCLLFCLPAVRCLLSVVC